MVVLIFSLFRDIILGFLAIIVINVLITEGWSGLASALLRLLLYIPGVKWSVSWYLRKEVRGFLKTLGINKGPGISSRIIPIPEKGLSNECLLDELKKRKGKDFNSDSGKGFAYVYTVHSKQFETIQKAFDLFQFHIEENEVSTDKDAVKADIANVFFRSFLHENALNPMVFPSLREFEVEVVSMTGWMLNGSDGVVGSVTSGGTESILMAMKTYRDRARSINPSIKCPEVVAPLTVHPAFEKAGAYFDIKIVHVPLDDDYKVKLDEYRKAITNNTILLVGSAPEYCYGIIDPISELSDLAIANGLPLHVDACFGGFMLPWVERLGYPVPVFDFRLKGVTSMSADVHKYGLGPKGSSVILYRSAEIRRHQIFAYCDWPGGLFGSPSMSGTRPGGNIASSWAAITSLGQDGYLNVADRLMKVTRSMKEGIKSIPELSLCGQSHMTAYAFTSSLVNIFAVADKMEEKGWKIERGSSCIHCTVLPSHNQEVVKEFIADLEESVDTVKSNPELATKGTAGVYGIAGKIPNRNIVNEFVTEFFNEVYTLS